MPRRIEHRSQFGHPAKKVYDTLVDQEYLRALLASQGGELVEHSGGEHGASFRIRHRLPGESLPGVVRTVISGDLVINRAETWERADDGYRGRSTVTIDNTPAKINATLRLADTGAGSELRNDGEVSVSVPLIGGKIEETIGEHVRKLLDTEGKFTATWLDQH